MKLSATEAAKRVGKSTPTITRAIKKGRISAKKNSSGGYEIDPAELFRVYPPIKNIPKDETVAQPLKSNATQPHNVTSETATIKKEVELLRERLADKDAVISDLRERLDKESEERRKLTALLTTEPKSFWKKIMGK